MAEFGLKKYNKYFLCVSNLHGICVVRRQMRHQYVEALQQKVRNSHRPRVVAVVDRIAQTQIDALLQHGDYGVNG